MFCPCRSADGTEQISFGELFKLNEKISNKCVGILQRARKHRLLHFPGETLWQGADDRVVISLVRKNRWDGGNIVRLLIFTILGISRSTSRIPGSCYLMAQEGTCG